MAETSWSKTDLPVFLLFGDSMVEGEQIFERDHFRTVLEKKISSIMKHSDHVSVSSKYMYDYAHLSCAKNITVIPPSVDEKRFLKCKKKKNDRFKKG